jgi:CheY-like chemotaxis protein
MVTAATSGQDALGKLELHAPDLIISETTFPEGDGFELRRRVRAKPEWSEIPFIFLTAEAAIENKIRGLELGVDDYLTKPIYIREIVTRINILLQKRQRVQFEERRDGRTRFAGRVQDMPVVDVIQTIEISRKSGVIQFVGDRGRQAAIYFRDGRVIDAEAGALQGEDAVYRLLTWSEGEFEVVFRTVRRREVITVSSQGLLMEGMRRLDEWSRLFEQLPPLTHRFEVDTIELAGRLGDVPDDNNRILRLFDGKRTLMEVIDASDVGDLECLQAMSRLYFEELLLDLDHDKAPRRDTGKPMPLVELDSASTDDDLALGSMLSGDSEVDGAATADGNGAGGGPSAGDRPGGPAEEDVWTEDDAGSGSEAGEDLSVATDAGGEDPGEADGFEETRGPLLGGYRPSSLRLIDEAVAAAQAIEPSLFEAASAAPAAGASGAGAAGSNGVGGEGHRSNGVSHAGPRPDGTLDDRAGMEAVAARPDREESGLRMIGSLGRDRAEASGELAPLGQARPHRSETARELVTILPRRATREMPAVTLDPSDASVAVDPTESVLVQPAIAQAVELPSAPLEGTLPRVSPAGSGVRAMSRSRRLLRLARSADGSGPGVGALLLIFLAAVLAVTAVVLRLRRHAHSTPHVEATQDPAQAGAALPSSSAPKTTDAPAPQGTSAALQTEAVPGEAAHGATAGAGTGSSRGGADASKSAARTIAGAGVTGEPVVRGDGTTKESGAASANRGVGAADRDDRAAGDPASVADRGDKAAGEAAGGRPAASSAAPTGSAQPAGPGDGTRTPGTAARAAGDPAMRSGSPRPDPAAGPDKAGEPRSADPGRAEAPGVADKAKALFDRARDAFDDGNSGRALELADASLKLRKTARTYLLRAQAEQRLDRVADALASVDAASRIAPEFAPVWELRGRILWAARRRDEARAAFEKFLALAPDDPKAATVRRLLNEPR